MLLKANGTLGKGVVEVNGARSCVNMTGCLYLEDMSGQAINTSRIVQAYQSGEMAVVFRTHSGSTYEVVLERSNELSSYFFNSIAGCVENGTSGFEPLKYCQLARFFRNQAVFYG